MPSRALFKPASVPKGSSNGMEGSSWGRSMKWNLTMMRRIWATAMRLPKKGSSHDVEKMVKSILSQMTIEEKVNYLAGAPPADPTLPNSTSQDIPPVPRLGLPELRNCDGPVGIRVS